jgi:hypothetical protein
VGVEKPSKCAIMLGTLYSAQAKKSHSRADHILATPLFLIKTRSS